MNLKDEQDRKNAVEICDKNIIVEAGAGTGKTTLLVKKILYLIFIEQVKLSRLIALTFTKKAAASLKQKLQEELYIAYKILQQDDVTATQPDDIKFEESLQKYSANEQEEFRRFRPLFKNYNSKVKELSEIIKIALEEIPFCQIGTIHSFCFFILKKYALEANLNPNINIDENEYIDVVFDRYWAMFLDEELFLGSKNKEIWLSVLKEISLEDLKGFARSLCTVKFCDYTPNENIALLKQAAEQHLKNAINVLQNAPTPDNKRSVMKPNLAKAIDATQQLLNVYEGKTVNITEIELSKSTPKKPSNWTDANYQIASDIIDFAKKHDPKSPMILNQAYKLVKPFTLKFLDEIKKQNYLTFDEIIYQTHHLLLNRKDVREELKRSYDRIFIDEFQDTDPMQGEVMLFLSEDINSFASRWKDLKLTPGKLFIVGDPKQSIYHFRGADISAYQDFCKLLEDQGAQICHLQNNFRSAEKIINFVNAFGQSQIQLIPKCQAQYNEIYHTKEFANPRLEMYLYNSDLRAGELRPNYAQGVAKWICENVKKTKKSDGTLLDYKDIAILMPITTDINLFLDALKENNIPYNVESDGKFYSAQEVLDFVNILKVLKNPKDQVALLGVLRSPVGLVTDTELLNLSKEKKLNIYAQSDNAKVQNIYDKLKDLKEKTARLNPVEITNEILEKFSFASYESLASLQEQTLANIYKIKQVVESIFNNGAYTIEQILDNLETYQKQKTKDAESSAILAEENFNVVKILTVHKAKGLEYPFVIFTDISRKPAAGRQSNEYYSRALGKRGLALGSFKDGIVPYIKAEKDTQETEEKKRLLYVAMTRAKEALIIIDQLNPPKNTLSVFLANAGCWPLKQETNLHGAQITYLEAKKADISYNKYNIPEDDKFKFNYPAWKEEHTKREEEYKKYLNTLQVKADNKTKYPLSPELEHATKVGTICHKMLQSIFTGTTCNLDGETDKNILKESKDIIDNFCKTPAFLQLKEMDFLAAEFPVTTIENGLTKTGVIDALFRTKEGKIKIIDFKSDTINIVSESARTVDQNYIAQLAFYKNALKKIFGGNVESALVYLRPAEIYNIED